MSFLDEYNKLKKKRLEEEEEEAKKTSSSGTSKNSFMDEYNRLKAERTVTETEDIAPVRTTVTKTEDKEEEKDRLFSLFDDGWDQGDLIATVDKGLRKAGNWLGNTAMSGLASFNSSLTKTADVILGKPLQALGWENNPISSVAGYYDKQADLWEEESKKATDELGGGKVLNFAREVVSGTAAAVPDAILAYMTAGTSTVGSLSTQAAYQGGNLLAKAGLTVETMMKNPSYWMSFARTYGSDYEKAKEAGADDVTAAFGATISSLINSGIEVGIDGMSGIQGLPKDIKDGGIKPVLAWAQSAFEEGGEEVLQGFVNNAVSKAMYDSDTELANLGDMAKEFALGTAVGGLLGGGQIAASSISNKVNTITEPQFTENESAVVEKVVKDRIAELEQKGEKITASKKSKIYVQVVSEMEKGDISIDTIEEVLGGETYKSYKDTIDSEDALKQEFDTLNKMKQGDMTGEQIDRRTELKQQLADLQTNSQRDSLKSKLSEEVFGLVKGDRLSESYNQKALRGQAFEADLTKYDTKQQETVKRAVESGVLNNTRRTHELVDLIAKISADKGVLFDFTNNAKLKETGFAIDGKQVNGFVQDGKITLNTQSAKYLNSVVGHEVTHVLEGTDLYKVLQDTVFEYAKSKGEYQTRYDALTEMYKNIEGANIDAELTADLVGDYLFMDNDFINNLSTKNRNVFQKIYDEIKYLYKTATAGSKEARELEKVKKAFENAYRADGTANSETKYSLTDKTKPTYEELVAKNPVQIVNVKGGIESGSYSDMKTAAMNKATSEGWFDVPHHNTDTDSLIFLTEKSFTHAYSNLRSDFGEDTIRCMAHIPEIIQNAVLVSVDDPRNPTKQETKVYTFFGAIDGVGGIEPVKLTVKEYDFSSLEAVPKNIRSYFEKNGVMESYDSLYDAHALEVIGIEGIKKESDASGRVYEQGSEAQATSDSKLNIADLLNLVKGDATKYIPEKKYSLSDSDGKKLTKEQQNYFKDSKMRDDSGNLMVMYHGSQDAGFHTFDSQMSDDGTSLFFVDRNDVAASYSGTSETYEAKTIRTPEDMNKFLAEIGYDHYEAVERNGKFELLENNEHVATKDTMQEIYEEFCWYEGVGEGDANYKVYLNLTNPLVVDAGGRNWNNISREYSQEVADRYHSLTDEEKAALSDVADWGEYSIFRDELLTVAKAASEGKLDEHSKILASAYNKLGGANANLFDAFSIAGDNFSEESINQFATKQMNTRDYAKKAKSEGYDGVIFKNLHDNGGYSNGSEGASTVAIAFDSNQIKSVANQKPTADPDIRYSLTEYTDEEKKAHNDIVLEHFGRTYKWAETGYVLLDGSRLDLSGRHEGAPGGYRTVDHRDIVDALGSDYGDDTYSGSLVQFMSEGNIRISPESNGINLSVKPNKAQEMSLSSFISNARGEVLLDIDDQNGYTVVSVEYPRGTHANKVLNDIREWFENGTEPKVSNFSQFRSLSNPGDTQKKYGNLAISGKDVALEATPEAVEQPVQEESAPSNDVAPVKETVSKTETVEPVGVEELFPDDLAPIDAELDRLIQEKETLESRMRNMADTDDYSDFDTVTDRYSAVMSRIQELEAEVKESDADRIDSLMDTDAPPEMEAPYPGDPSNDYVDDPFQERDWYEVGKRNVKAYMYENPEVKPFFQDEAMSLWGELNDTTKGERFYSAEAFNRTGNEDAWTGVKRHTSDSIAELLDSWHMSYADIEKGLKAIIEDNGAENIAAAKKLEFMLNDRLLNGYKDFYSNGRIPPNQDYINLLNEKQINEYSKEAFDRFMETADQYAPEDIAPVPEVAEENTVSEAPKAVVQDAPVAEKYEAIKPNKKQRREPSMIRADKAQQNTEPPKVAEVMSEEPQAAKRNSRVWSRFVANFGDKGNVFETLSLKTKNRELQARYNSLHYAEGRAQKLLGEGTTGVKSLNDIRADVEKSGKTKKFYEYLYHLHNVDRMQLEGRYNDTPNKPVFGDAVTADMSRAAATELAKENPEFRNWSQDVYRFNSYLRKLLVDGGVISQETADLWSEMYPHYVPIRRAGDDGLNIDVPLDTRKTGVNAPVKKATGGSRDILPLFDTMAQRTLQTYKAIAKNRFGVELKNTLGTTIEKEATSVDGIIDSVDQQEGLLQEGKNGKAPTFTVFENGEKVTFEITEDMYDALKPTSSGLAYTNKVANTISNFRRGLLTEYNPTFILTNAIKDAQDVLINSQHAVKTYATFPKAIQQLASKGKWYTEYMENGGEQNTYFDNKTNTFEKEKSVFVKVIGFPLEAISTANNFIERVPRLAEYIASREAGRSIDVSMLDAARVTTNFAAGGDITKFINRNGATFLNASVQGFMQNVRNGREAKANGLKGVGVLATKVAVAGLSGLLLNHLLWDDDEDYEELSDYVKQNYYIVGKYGDGQFVRIPKGRMLAVIQNAFEQMQNAITGDDEIDLKAFGDLFFSNLAPNDPLDNNIISPILQVAQNKTWYGEDLIPTRLQKLPEAEQFDETTDAISKWLGEKLNVSPVKINYLLDQYSGGIGDTFLPMLTPSAERGDTSLAGKMIAPLKDKFTTDSVLKNQNITDFYDKVDELAVKANSAKATDKDVLMSKYMNSISSEMSELYQQKREIQNSDLADDEKYSKVREIQQQIVDLTKEGMSNYQTISYEDDYREGGEYARIADKVYKLNDKGEWSKLSDEQQTKYEVTKAAGNASYATDGTNHYRWYVPGEDTSSDAEPGWKKITEDQLEKQQKVTRSLNIEPEEYWGSKEEYDYAYEYPEKYVVAKAVGGYSAYKSYSSELYDIKADKDKNGKSITGSRKDKVIDYINNLDADYGEKIILFKSEYNADDTYNYEIIDYLNSREDISYEEMETILKELGFNISSDGTITWD